ncbi:hypothetical protein, partial [Mycobacterium avium]|uniref:hypothetical protein n=1 Tax=Mycobacterium avium TaxID=1764 RepID=UPI001F342A3B
PPSTGLRHATSRHHLVHLFPGRNYALPVDPEPDLPLRFALYLAVAIRGTPEGPQLTANWLWSDALFEHSDIERLTQFWQRGIAALAAGLTKSPA